MCLALHHEIKALWFLSWIGFDFEGNNDAVACSAIALISGGVDGSSSGSISCSNDKKSCSYLGRWLFHPRAVLALVTLGPIPLHSGEKDPLIALGTKYTILPSIPLPYITPFYALPSHS
jgi:hypothetical protein